MTPKRGEACHEGARARNEDVKCDHGVGRSELSSSEVTGKRGERSDVVVLVVPQILAIHYGTKKVEGLGGSGGESCRANAAACNTGLDRSSSSFYVSKKCFSLKHPFSAQWLHIWKHLLFVIYPLL